MMSRRISISRAARLVGTRRGEIQKRIQDGELSSFEGELSLDELVEKYPDIKLEDDRMLEKTDQLRDSATTLLVDDRGDLPDRSTLAARISKLGRELQQARLDKQQLHGIIDHLKERLAAQKDSALLHWLERQLAMQTTPNRAVDVLHDRDTLLSIMSAHVRILPSGHDYFVDGNSSILDAGLQAGLKLDYGCSNGNCGDCKAKLLSGEIRQLGHYDYVLSEKEKQQGIILTCCHTPVTDIVLETDEAAGAGDIEEQQVEMRVKRIERAGTGTIILELRTPRNRRLRFISGQYVKLVYQGCECSLSIASCPCDESLIQFHIDLATREPGTLELLEKLKSGDKISIRGPYGDFILDFDSPRSLFFAVLDHGFGAIKALVENAMAIDSAEEIHLFWSAHPNGHYMQNLCRSWEDVIDNFHYHHMEHNSPSQAVEQMEQCLASIKGSEDFDVYACADVGMHDDLLMAFDRAGIETDRIRIEKAR